MRAFLMRRMGLSAYRSHCSGTEQEFAGLSSWPSWRATSLHGTDSMKAALGPWHLIHTAVSQACVPDVQDRTQRLPVTLFWDRTRVCRPVKLAQLVGNEPAQHSRHEDSTWILSPHTHSVSQACVPDVQDRTQRLPVSLFWDRSRVCRPVKMAQLEGNEPAQHRQHVGSTWAPSPHTHSRQPGMRSWCAGWDTAPTRWLVMPQMKRLNTVKLAELNSFNRG